MHRIVGLGWSALTAWAVMSLRAAELHSESQVLVRDSVADMAFIITFISISGA